MDYIRTAYTVNMQFDEAGEIIVPVTWYFAADGAQDFPGYHLFGSARSWQEHQLPILGLGERWDSKPSYYNGAQPFFAPGLGGFCGDPDWYVNGCPSDAPPIQYSAAGVPTCCPQPPCQPWYVAGLAASTISSNYAGIGPFSQVDFDPFSVTFVDNNNNGGTWTQGISSCGSEHNVESAGFVINAFPPQQDLQLSSYDAETFTGTWIPTFPQFFPPGLEVYFRLPRT